MRLDRNQPDHQQRPRQQKASTRLHTLGQFGQAPHKRKSRQVDHATGTAQRTEGLLETRHLAERGQGEKQQRCAEPEVDQAAHLITPRTKAIALVSPNNPTGVEYPPELIRAFYDLAQAKGIALILDETYCDFRGSNDAAHDLHHTDEYMMI